jgi:serine/threonine protein kinase
MEGITSLDNIDELSKSRFFIVKDGTVHLFEQLADNSAAPNRVTTGIIDQKYRIISLLGAGGMGAVYRAHHMMLDKDVALKTFRSASLTEEALLRFQREAQAIAILKHKNIIQIFDFGLSQDGVPYYTMEYLLGETLEARVRKNGPLAPAEAIELFAQICQGLSLAHSKGIIHRDLKPANLIIETALSPKGKTDTIKINDLCTTGHENLATHAAGLGHC